jgi:O-antigen/teichoic acid export membrane protein
MIRRAYKNHRETIHNFIWRCLQLVGKQGIITLIFILCARLLTPYDFGIYNYALAIIFFLITFGDFGISAATSKYVAEYHGSNKDKLKAVPFNSAIIILGLTLIIAILTILIGPWYLKEKYGYVLWLLPLMFIAPMTSLYDGIYRGLKKFKLLAIISLIVGTFSLSFVYILIKNYGLTGALIAQDLFYLILFLSLGFGYREFHFKWNWGVIREVGRYSIIVGLVNAGFFLYTTMNSIILGKFGYIAEVGYYELINKVFLFLTLPFSIIGQVIAPDITNLASKNDFSQIQNKFKKTFFILLLLGILFSILLYLFLPLVLRTYLSKYSTPEFNVMFNIMLFTLPFTIVSGTMSQGFTIAAGKAKYGLLTIPFGVLNLILGVILINLIGFIGVIISFLISSTISRGWGFFLVYRGIGNSKK